jgi:hypothetical protein
MSAILPTDKTIVTDIVCQDSSEEQQQKENKMAEYTHDYSSLHSEHGAIRHDIAVESARLGAQIGAESCAINKHIGDARQEDAENFGHTRRDIQGTSADIRKEQAVGFGETRYNIAERAGDIRREAAEHTNEIIKEGLKESFNIRGDVKDTRFDVVTRVDAQGDRVVDRLTEHDSKVGDRFFVVGRDLADIRQGQATLAKDIELNALKTQLEGQKNTQFLSDKITIDGEKTRTLINDLKFHDLNRNLVERNAELVNCEQDRRRYHDRWYDSRFDQVQTQFAGQWAQLQNQVQAFQSQLQETRQGMVNFGTMAGNSGQQSSTSNNVR